VAFLVPANITLVASRVFILISAFLLASCGSIEISGIKAHQSDFSSAELRPYPLTKHPIMEIGRTGKKNNNFSIVLGMNSEGKLYLNTYNTGYSVCHSKRFIRNKTFIVDLRGEIQPYDGKAQWCLLALWSNDIIYLVWNKEIAGENIHFKSKRHHYVYKKIKSDRSLKEVNNILRHCLTKRRASIFPQRDKALPIRK